MIGFRSIVLVGALVLAGCTAPPVSSDTAPRFGEVKARFVKGRDVDVIEVRALETIAIRSAVLNLPGGVRVPAEQIDANASPEVPNRLATATGQYQAPPVGQSAPTITLVGQIASVALIRIPDPQAYRDGWKNATIDVQLGSPGDQRNDRLPAPPPP
jgi:hypothetical protein